MNDLLHGLAALASRDSSVILTGWRPSLAAAVLAIAALWLWIARLNGPAVGRGRLVLLSLLRLAAVACVLLALLRPVSTITRVQRQPKSLAVGIDVSGSMALTDPRTRAEAAARSERTLGADPRTTPRLRRAIRTLTLAKTGKSNGDPPASSLDRLGRTFALKLFTFGDTVSPVERSAFRTERRSTITAGNPRTGATRIGDAIRDILDQTSGSALAGIVLLTDGGSNSGDDPVSWAKKAGSLGVPIHTVGIGDPTPTKDLAIVDVLADRVVRKGAEVRITAGLTQRGYGGRTVTVSLDRSGTVLASRQVALRSGEARANVPLTYTPKTTGDGALRVRVSMLGGEALHTNNRKAFLQQVVDKKLRVLYIEGEPRWEYRYLKNAILRDDQIGFACFTVDDEGAPTARGNLPVRSFPEKLDDLFSYDVVVLGDVPRVMFGDSELRNLRRFVEDRGGSLIVIAGERHMPHEYAGALLEPVLPFRFSGVPSAVTADQPFRLAPTDYGAQDPILSLAPNPEENRRIWQELPGMLWMCSSRGLRPGATALAVNSATGMPALAVQPFGAGRCLMTMTDSTWRWRWRVGDRYFYRFWGQILRTMTPRDNPGGNKRAQLSVDESDYRPGDRVGLTARVLDEFYRPMDRANVAVRLSREGDGRGRSPRTVRLKPLPGSPGVYTGTAEAGEIGSHRATLMSEQISGPEVYARYIVRDAAVELQQPERHDDLLKQIARVSGGTFMEPEDVAGWVSRQKRILLRFRSVEERDLWNAPALLGLCLGLLSVEWILRRRWGLA